MYEEQILDHYHAPRNTGDIENPSGKVMLSNPLCGDEITLYVRTEGDVVRDIKYKATGCAISIASASMISEELLGKTKQEILGFDRDKLLALLGITLTPMRLKCALLPLEALQKAVQS